MTFISVSTKTGDNGTSGLANGERHTKDELIFEVLGTQDEVNAWLGLALVKLKTDPAQQELTKHTSFVSQIQDTLFHIGAELALSPKTKLSDQALANLEKISLELQKQMAEGWTTKFVYPGGTDAAATLDVARTVARRLERRVVELSHQQTVRSEVLKYINRLSDYLFVLRCYVNQVNDYQEQRFTVAKTYQETFMK